MEEDSPSPTAKTSRAPSQRLPSRSFAKGTSSHRVGFASRSGTKDVSPPTSPTAHEKSLAERLRETMRKDSSKDGARETFSSRRSIVITDEGEVVPAAVTPSNVRAISAWANIRTQFRAAKIAQGATNLVADILSSSRRRAEVAPESRRAADPLQEQLQQLDGFVKELEIELQNKEEEIVTLNAQLMEAKRRERLSLEMKQQWAPPQSNIAKEYDDMVEELHHLEEQFKQLQSAHDRIRVDHNDATEENRELTKQLEDAQMELRSLRKSEGDLRKSTADLKKELSTMKKKSALSQAIKLGFTQTATEKAAVKEEAFQEEKTALEKELEEKRQDAARLQASSDQWENRCAILEEYSKRMEMEKRELQDLLDEYRRSKGSITGTPAHAPQRYSEGAQSAASGTMAARDSDAGSPMAQMEPMEPAKGPKRKATLAQELAQSLREFQAQHGYGEGDSDEEEEEEMSEEESEEMSPVGGGRFELEILRSRTVELEKENGGLRVEIKKLGKQLRTLKTVVFPAEAGMTQLRRRHSAVGLGEGEPRPSDRSPRAAKAEPSKRLRFDVQVMEEEEEIDVFDITLPPRSWSAPGMIRLPEKERVSDPERLEVKVEPSAPPAPAVPVPVLQLQALRKPVVAEGTQTWREMQKEAAMQTEKEETPPPPPPPPLPVHVPPPGEPPVPLPPVDTGDEETLKALQEMRGDVGRLREHVKTITDLQQKLKDKLRYRSSPHLPKAPAPRPVELDNNLLRQMSHPSLRPIHIVHRHSYHFLAPPVLSPRMHPPLIQRSLSPPTANPFARSTSVPQQTLPPFLSRLPVSPGVTSQLLAPVTLDLSGPIHGPSLPHRTRPPVHPFLSPRGPPSTSLYQSPVPVISPLRLDRMPGRHGPPMVMSARPAETRPLVMVAGRPLSPHVDDRDIRGKQERPSCCRQGPPPPPRQHRERRRLRSSLGEAGQPSQQQENKRRNIGPKRGGKDRAGETGKVRRAAGDQGLCCT
ncbi:unnamed protein product [Vitrella brassicaformis CCMP3155]|uniref:Uncharacterized protein n=2 Tax=Vitrella brassicaformis TaxID=1169539 RepID=A0A0G4H7S5_VITBC|nr:unnamed protein product [Vitrella brassicaformis CCMP3155]|eukprot:CEM39958.1 unnamed protein product [Vitrella brassicaformis CCMP3155]